MVPGDLVTTCVRTVLSEAPGFIMLSANWCTGELLPGTVCVIVGVTTVSRGDGLCHLDEVLVLSPYGLGWAYAERFTLQVPVSPCQT